MNDDIQEYKISVWDNNSRQAAIMKIHYNWANIQSRIQQSWTPAKQTDYTHTKKK